TRPVVQAGDHPDPGAGRDGRPDPGAGKVPRRAAAAWGRRAHRLERDPETEHVVRWMFAQRLAGHSAARITRALNDAGVPCPSAADPARNPHRAGTAWTLRTVAAILANPRYTGRQVWNRQPSGQVLVDPADTGLGHRQVQQWNLPEGWVISRHPAHAALVTEEDFIKAQDTSGPRGPAGPAVRRYLLAGLLACRRCGRRLESAWSHGWPAYRCRHGYASAARPEPGRPPNTYVREQEILPHLGAVAILLAGPAPAGINRGQVQVTAPAVTAALIDRLRRRRRPHLRPERPDPARRRPRPAVRHHRQEPLTAGLGKGGPPSEEKKNHPPQPEAEHG
ncbi:MAG: recombinase family protein, partial [Trebonia sp.]